MDGSFLNSRGLKKRKGESKTIDFSMLDLTALRKYRRTFKLRTRQNSTKSELVSAVAKHSSTMVVIEMEVIQQFLEALNNSDFTSFELRTFL
ncbi:hypothetical protein PROFUN_05102 [Planoprotostelium fungivorum]|uniref:Histone deacetylase complex subunit SAP30 Sin3 binding domain-containing protein n=1 Tax=Planoprotostelium fungivorum TaxID=1890364 RepID=A0A2P6NRM4_9EUKA|nr:hypothetical protein PROFUN_05102 [Planoprotostelium fungivorum]